jgi:hypothetical protein
MTLSCRDQPASLFIHAIEGHHRTPKAPANLRAPWRGYFRLSRTIATILLSYACLQTLSSYLGVFYLVCKRLECDNY